MRQGGSQGMPRLRRPTGLAAAAPSDAPCFRSPPFRDDGDKQRELQELRRTGGTSNMRVGPAAAKQLLQLLRCDDPGLKVKKGE